MSLEEHNITNSIDRVADGVEAMAYLRREGIYADAPTPDVILLDLKLPKLDGHEVLERIKSSQALRSIPVVILTTSNNESDLAAAYARHANSYLTKPVDFQQFQQMVRDLKLYWTVWNQPPVAGASTSHAARRPTAHASRELVESAAATGPARSVTDTSCGGTPTTRT